ncbi:MAG TPA: hypothetical protein VJN01_13430 [Xanthomonadales bacterium]|nr:hypothetical protein [Xanthomonadales bacterium]
MKLYRPLLVCLGLMATVMPVNAAQDTATAELQQDGWYRWQIDAVHPAPDWCCHSWKSSQVGGGGCDLDSRNQGFSSSGRSNANYVGDLMDIYARMEQGRMSELRAFSPDCPVRSDSDIKDLGHMDATDSLALLQSAGVSKKSTSDQRIAVLAVHAGPEAGDILSRMAADTSSKLETRKQSVFWMAQLRFAESREQLLQIIEQEPSAELREHAAFSYSQSDAPDRVEVLIGIIEDRQRDFSDRSNALFWLAESDSREGVDYIQNLLTARN